MFKFRYQYDPLTYTPSNNALKRAKKAKNRATKFASKKLTYRTVAKCIRQVIRYCSFIYGFSCSKFINDNFCNKKKMLILRENKIKNLKSSKSQALVPNECDKSNYKQVIHHIKNEAKMIRTAPFAAFEQEPLLSNVITPNLNESELRSEINSAFSNSDKSDQKVEQTTYPFTNNVRSKLGKLWKPGNDHFYTFYATFNGIKKHSPHEQKEAALLESIYHNHQEVSSHNWIFGKNKDKISNQHFTKGQCIAFRAKVQIYKKGIANNGINNKYYDFNLTDLNNIHLATPEDKQTNDSLTCLNNTAQHVTSAENKSSQKLATSSVDTSKALRKKSSENNMNKDKNMAMNTNNVSHSSLNNIDFNSVEKSVLIKALGKLLDKHQLSDLIHIKLGKDAEAIPPLAKKLADLEKRVKVIRNSLNTLKTNDSSCHQVLSIGSNQINDLKAKAKSSKILTQKKASLISREKSFQLVGTEKLLRIVTKVINGDSRDKIGVPYTTFSHANGVATRLEKFDNGYRKDHDKIPIFSLNGDNEIFITPYQLEDIARNYQDNEVKALHYYYQNSGKVAINHIEKMFHFTTGTLLKLRRSTKANALCEQIYGDTDAEAKSETSNEPKKTSQEHSSFSAKDLIKKAKEHNV